MLGLVSSATAYGWSILFGVYDMLDGGWQYGDIRQLGVTKDVFGLTQVH